VKKIIIFYNFCVFLLLVFGFFSLFTVTHTANLWKKQLIWVGLSIITYLIISFKIPHTIWEIVGGISYVISVILLILVLIIGIKVNGAKSWFNLYFMRFQPSEFSKVSLILFLSTYLYHNIENIKKIKTILIYFCIAALPIFLIFLQPDLGTILTILPFIIILPFFAGFPSKYLIYSLIIFTIIFTISFPFIWKKMPVYQKNRILAFLYPEKYKLSKSYNVYQAQIAIGSGKLYGKGIFKGSQVNNKLLPAYYTDFIFAAICEQVGFIGAIFILFLFFLLMLSMGLLCIFSSNLFAKFLTFAVMVLIGTHVIINIAVNLSLMPATGIPLPFFSYGGSFLFTIFLLLGIINNMHISFERMLFK